MDNKFKVAIILPYFGKLPNYFQLWIKSAEMNKDFDFLIFTDNTNVYTCSENIKWHICEFKDIVNKVQKFFDFKIILNRPYKLCDYKPMYGLIFSDYLKNYDWWGHCDSDLIFGNLSSKITSEVLNLYEKIYQLGHLTLYKNNKKMNNLWRVILAKEAYSFKEAYRTRYPTHFDEQLGMTKIAIASNIKTYNNIDFADMRVDVPGFQRCWDVNSGHLPHIFSWNNGKLYGYYVDENKEITKKEYIYIHLQKRKMLINEYKNSDCKDMLIIPNAFINYEKEKINSNYIIYVNESIKAEQNSSIKQIKIRFKNLLLGSLKNKYIRWKKEIVVPR